MDDPDIKYRHDMVWVKASQKMMTVSMPYLTKGHVAYAVNKLIDRGYIKKGRYSENKFDHTNWYAFTEYGSLVMDYGEDYEDD